VLQCANRKPKVDSRLLSDLIHDADPYAAGPFSVEL
jgi:hypothetical protein